MEEMRPRKNVYSKFKKAKEKLGNHQRANQLTLEYGNLMYFVQKKDNA